MKTVNEYSSDTVNALKRWLGGMAEQGHTKYYEILVDGMRVVYKTSNLEDYDQHIKWMDETSQSMRVLVYNTKNSHRSMPFEFRTEKYVDGLSDKLYPTRNRNLNEDEVNRRVEQTVEQRQKEQDFANLQKQNHTLTKRVGDAEDYIRKLELKLEDKKDDKEDFDFGSMLKMASVMADKNPVLKKQLEDFGITSLVNEQEAQVTSQDAEEPTATFKRKEPTSDSVRKDASIIQDNIVSDEPNEKDYFIFKTDAVLEEDHAMKLHELIQFLTEKQEYINIIHEIIIMEKEKKAA